MYLKSAAGLSLLALSAACAPGRQPVASAPAPAPAAPAPAAVEPVMPVEEGVELRGAPAPVGADLLGDAEYDLPVVANEWVRSELEFLVYQRHEVVAGWLRAADRYDEWVRDVFASYGIPRDLHHLGMMESGYRPTVRSHAGAVGMWQFMPATGRGMGLRIDTLVDERMDPVRATHAAARHLRDLYRRMGRDWSLAAAAYNAGEGRINRAMGRYGATDFWDVAQRGNLAQETRRYVPRLYAVTIIGKDPQRFGYPASTGGRRFAYDSVRVDLATPLTVLAQIGNLPASELVDLNPHMLRQVAPRNYWVWVPLGQGAPLQQAFASSEFRQRGGFAVYRVREGETLGRLAELSGVPEDRIRTMNLSSTVDNLRPGDRLRLYADAVRVLDARPAERPARRSGPRVLGDPAPAAEGGTSEGRSEASATARRTESSASSSTRRSGSSSSSRSGEASSSSARRSSESASSSGSRRSTESASSERRSGSSISERTASSQRRGDSASASTSRPSSSSSTSSASSARRSEGTRGGSSSTTASSRSHTVEDGETLWGIARRFDVTVDAVREANGLDEDDHIQPGQTLRIPRAAGSSTASSSTRAESGSRPAASSERRASTESASGTRRSADSASAGRRSGSASRPALSTIARTGSAGEERRSGNSSSTARSSSGGATRTREHTVGAGETLWGIARRYETTVESLRRVNDLAEDAQIQPGQKLRIPEN
jgi:membrane-bound lytic murein transglycosylase D